MSCSNMLKTFGVCLDDKPTLGDGHARHARNARHAPEISNTGWMTIPQCKCLEGRHITSQGFPMDLQSPWAGLNRTHRAVERLRYCKGD